MRFAALLVGLALSLLPAQTFIVNAAGGAGSHFTDLPTAVAAVPNGAVLIVRPGTYAPFVIDNKALAVLADPGVTVFGLLSQVVVRNLSPTKSVTLRRLRLEVAYQAVPLELEYCAGTVLIEAVTAYSPGTFFGGGLRVRYCNDVRIRDSSFQQDYNTDRTAWCFNSTVTASQSVFVHHGMGAGMIVEGGRVELTDCGLGGRGGYPPFAAIYMLGGSLRVLGNSLLSTTWSPATQGQWVVWGSGDARIDPSVTLASGTGVPVVVNGALSYIAMPVVTAATGPLGSIAGATLNGPLAPSVLFAGPIGPPTSVLPFADPLLLQPSAAIAMAAGSPPLGAAYVVPSQPALLGAQLGWQGITIGTAWQLSNCSTYVHW